MRTVPAAADEKHQLHAHDDPFRILPGTVYTEIRHLTDQEPAAVPRTQAGAADSPGESGGQAVVAVNTFDVRGQPGRERRTARTSRVQPARNIRLLRRKIHESTCT